MNSQPQSHALRRGRHSEPGRYYLITATTKHRQPVFRDLYAARTLINLFRETSLRNQAQTWTYVVMPDHFHWPMQLEDGNLGSTVGRVKRLASASAGRSLWQDGFHDRAARREDDLKAIARYIIANPVRAGLVDSVVDYPHWDAVWL